jgi:hypothetical protein
MIHANRLTSLLFIGVSGFIPSGVPGIVPAVRDRKNNISARDFLMPQECPRAFLISLLPHKIF